MSKINYFTKNCQKSPSARGSPPPAPLNVRLWWPEVAWFGQILFFKLIMMKSNFKKSVMMSLQCMVSSFSRHRKTWPN